MVTDLEQLSLHPETINSQPSLCTPRSLCCRDRGDIHQLPELMPDIGNLPMHANAIDPHRDVLDFQTSIFDSDSPLEKSYIIDMKKYQEQSQSSKQQHFPPGFRFLNFCLGSGNTPWLENPPCHHPLTWLSDKCLLWADPGSTKRRQNRPCAEEAPGLWQEQGRTMDPDHWVRWSIGLGSPEGCGSQRREHSLTSWRCTRPQRFWRYQTLCRLGPAAATVLLPTSSMHLPTSSASPYQWPATFHLLQGTSCIHTPDQVCKMRLGNQLMNPFPGRGFKVS